MSTDSSARGDSGRKPLSPITPASPMPAHAHLLDARGQVVGGIAERDNEWVLVLGGRVITATESAGMAMAVLERAAIARGAPGAPLRTRCGDSLRDAATAEAVASGQTLEAYLAALEAERVEHLRKKQQAGNAGPAS